MPRGSLVSLRATLVGVILVPPGFLGPFLGCLVSRRGPTIHCPQLGHQWIEAGPLGSSESRWPKPGRDAALSKTEQRARGRPGGEAPGVGTSFLRHPLSPCSTPASPQGPAEALARAGLTRKVPATGQSCGVSVRPVTGGFSDPQVERWTDGGGEVGWGRTGRWGVAWPRLVCTVSREFYSPRT